MFKKKKLIPLDQLTSALKLCRDLQEEYDKKFTNNFYPISLHIWHYKSFSIDRIEEKIEEHGYKKIDGQFYLLSDLKNTPSISEDDYSKDGKTMYSKDILSLLTPLNIA